MPTRRLTPTSARRTMPAARPRRVVLRLTAPISASDIERCADLVDHPLQRCETAIDEIKTRGIEIDDVALAPGLGFANEVVVEKLPRRLSTDINGRVAVENEQPVGIDLADEFERDRLAVQTDLHFGGGEPDVERIVD